MNLKCRIAALESVEARAAVQLLHTPARENLIREHEPPSALPRPPM